MNKMQDFKSVINPLVNNIWRYENFYPPVAEEFRLSLDEGWTDYNKVDGILFKREDTNPTGSVKDRGMAYQISDAYVNGDNHLVLSSSGNAAISAAYYTRLAGIKLSVFVSPRIEKEKFKKLQRLNVDLHISDSPIKDAAAFRKNNNLRNLRQSLDEKAVYGYMSLGFELYEQLFPNLIKGTVSIFIPVSSATNLVGIGRAFVTVKKLKLINQLPEIHAVQTVYTNPISRNFDTPDTKNGFDISGLGIAKALCAKTTHRQQEAISIIKESHGFGWIVDDVEIKDALDWLDARNINTSAEGAAALAGIFKAKKSRDIGTPLCLLTGKRYRKVE